MASFPTLDLKGWTKTPITTLDEIIGNFLVADHLDSDAYREEVSSLKYIVGENSHDVNELKRAIEDRLSILIKRYYPDSIIEVSVRDSQTNDDATIIQMSVRVNHNSQYYELSKSVEAIGSSIRKII